MTEQRQMNEPVQDLNAHPVRSPEPGAALSNTLAFTDNARNHLSNERTYLSWIRTVMAFVGFGLVFTKLSSGTASLAIGITFVSAGILLLVQAYLRYNNLKEALDKGQYAPSAFIIIMATFITLFATIASLFVLILFRA